MNEYGLTNQSDIDELAILREVSDLRRRRFKQIRIASSRDFFENVTNEEGSSPKPPQQKNRGKRDVCEDEATDIMSAMREVNDLRRQRFRQMRKIPGNFEFENVETKTGCTEELHSADEISYFLLKAALSKNADSAVSVLRRISSLSAQDSSFIHLALHPVPLLKTLSAFESNSEVAMKVLNIIQKLMKKTNCAKEAIASRKYIRLYVRMIALHPRNITICSQLFMLLEDVSGSGECGVGKELVESGLASELVTLLSPRGERTSDADVMKGVILLVLYYVSNVPVMLPALFEANMVDSLSRHALKYRGDAFGNAISAAIGSIRAVANGDGSDDDEIIAKTNV